MNVDIAPTVIYSVMMGMTLFALFDVVNRPKQRQSVFLSVLLLLLLIHILGELFIYSGAYVYAPGLAGMQFPLRVLLGPALYFYAYASMSPQKKLSIKAYLLALLGPIIVIAGILPFIFISPEDKLAMANPLTRDPELFKVALFACFFSMAAFVIFTAVYLWATFKLQQQHRIQLLERFSSIEKRSMDWFKIILVLWGCVWLLFTIEYTISFMGLKWFGSGVVIPVLEALVLMTFSHKALKQPILAESDKSLTQVKRPRTSHLTQNQMSAITEKLKCSMAEKELFLEEDLSLKRLSEELEVSENNISETLSQHLNTNFFKFINEHRVQKAKLLLKSSDKNISTIGYESGFNSKSTFNSAFKRSTGMTPSSFKYQELVNSH